MVLLTSGQVSVAITSIVGQFYSSEINWQMLTVIVLLFTSALFLSGYAIQQQTVRDLRAAIKPHVQPPQIKPHLPAKFAKPSPKEYGVQVQVQKSIQDSTGGTVAAGESSEETAIQQRQIKLTDQQSINLLPGNGKAPEIKSQPDKKGIPMEKPMSRAERRRKLKEELTAGSEEEGFKGYRRRMW